MQTTPAALTKSATYEADGFSLTLTCQLSSSAQSRELQALTAQGQSANIPESIRQTMLDRLAGAIDQTLCEAHPRLLASLVAVAYEHQLDLNQTAILDQIQADTEATTPTPGQPWPEQGGIYLGIAPAEGNLPMRHLVALAESDDPMDWKAAVQWAQSQGNGARLPTQLESMIAYTVARAAFKKGGYWTGTQDGRNFAFVQYFEDGNSYWYFKGNEFRVRPVRGLDLQTLTPLTGDAAAAPVEKI